MGTTWHSEPGKNLTFSMLKKFSSFKATDQFFISIQVCLTVYNTLKHLSIPNLRIKWPNDILSGSHKVCGVLIESIIAGNEIKSAIIGIGLNVNQTNFSNLTNVSSLKLLTGTTFDLDEVLQKIVSNLKYGFRFLRELDAESLQSTYESKLFMKNDLATFEFLDGQSKKGIIKGITRAGKLRVEFDAEPITEFNFKEVKLLC